MELSIPFELNQEVYVIEKVRYLEREEWIPPNWSAGGDADGPFERGYYNKIYNYKLEIKKIKFYFGLLDKYSLDEIYATYEDANWALLIKQKKEKEER